MIAGIEGSEHAVGSGLTAQSKVRGSVVETMPYPWPRVITVFREASMQREGAI